MQKLLGSILLWLVMLQSSDAVAQLNYSTYHCPNWPCPQSDLQALSTGQVNQIGFNWGSGIVLNSGRSDQVSVKFTGYISWPGSSGSSKTVNFYAASDDSFQLKINNTIVINDWGGLHGMSRFNSSGSATLIPGQTYTIEVWFAEWGGGAGVELWWDTGTGIELVPAQVFTTVSPTPAYASEITATQLAQYTTIRNRQSNNPSGNRIYLDHTYGIANSINIEQSGNSNNISGIGGNNFATISGNNNTVNVLQGSVLGSNLLEFSIVGDLNVVSIWQARNSLTGLGNSSESGNHYAGVSIAGNSNNVVLKQSNDGSQNSGHFSILNVIGNANTVSVEQKNNNEKRLFATINSSNATLGAHQSGTGNHYLDIQLTGNGHQVQVNQANSGTHKATINLSNSGGSSSLNLTQQGINNQIYSISQQCANLSGCYVNIIQGN